MDVQTITQIPADDKIVTQTEVPKRIAQIAFGVMSDEDIRRSSVIRVVNRELYQTPSRNPFPYGVLDPRLGTSSKRQYCETCGLHLKDCVGHYGYIKLELPVFHIGYFKTIIEVLQRICKTCSRILLNDELCHKYLRIMRNPKLESLKRKGWMQRILQMCKKVTRCPHCDAINGNVKKVGQLKIVHEVYSSKAKDKEDMVQDFRNSFEEAIRHNPDIKPYIPKAQEDINPLKALRLFKKIPDEDVELFDMDPTLCRPELLIMTHILVPPVCIRPSVPSDMGSNEDDLTVSLTRIIHTDEIIRENIKKGVAIENLMTQWDFLQSQVALYINSEQPGLAAAKEHPGKPMRSLCQRLKGKSGRFRGNLSGKRVDFSGRTVISPDPNLNLDQVAVPVLVAQVLTYPERVTEHNREWLKQLILNGPDVHPGANFVESAGTGNKRYLKFTDRKKVAEQLQIGDIVERHLCDGDMVLFNRQPSLHRLSIMCHRAKVLPYRTFRFNICDCHPYNADFDGDEMNLHVPQTEEAKAEAFSLMSVPLNLLTPRNGEPTIGCTQDILTGSWLLTRKDMFFERSEFCQLCCYMGLNVSKIDLPPPTILKPMELWTGKQAISLLIKPNDQTDVLLNMESKARNYQLNSAIEKDPKQMCANDGYVSFLNSTHVSGNLDKKVLGDGSKSTVFFFLQKKYGAHYAAECMARFTKLATTWLKNYGFSIGIDDVTPSPRLLEEKQRLIDEGYKQAANIIAEWKAGKLKPQPGCTAEQTLEAELNKLLSDIRSDAGNVCVQTLHPTNAPLIMATCGSKGSVINISQMVACVGQQTVSGSRIQNGFMNRTLPHFPYFSRDPDAKGFVKNSFYSGLTPTEFFFHTMAGREGLVDTAVKTAETGYMQRRLIKALEDLTVHYDHTVRNAENTIVQFDYGDDGLEPINMEEEEGRPIHLANLFMDVINTTPCPDEKPLTESEILEITKKHLEENTVDENMIMRKEFYDNFAFRDKYSLMFGEEVHKFIKGFCDSLTDLRINLKIEDEKLRETILNKIKRLTKTQLLKFLDKIKTKYSQLFSEPGEAVGAVAGQSIGEPGTQMTLKTFHFAGVASMNVTLGVPRIVEIINATRHISTPIITGELVSKTDEIAARIVKGRIEKTTLGQVAEYIREVYDLGICCIDIKLDDETIRALQLEITPASVVKSILCTPKIKLKEKFVRIHDDHIRVYPPETGREEMFFCIQHLKRVLPKVVVSGVPTISRVVINKKPKTSELNLLAEGTNLRAVMGTPGVNGLLTKSNNVLEVEETLGIEAARKTIMDEIQYTMKSYGMSIDSRHVMLLGDIMSFKGEILGITRFGISKMKDSVLTLASFERTTDHLFEASVRTRKERIQGVSECIIMGIPIMLGTGLFKLMRQVDKKLPPMRKPIFFNYENKTIQ